MQASFFEPYKSMRSELRPYQVGGFQAAVNFFNQPSPKPGILVAPTAYGKSVLIAHVAEAITGKTLVLQPTKELLKQNYEKFIALGGRAAIYSASAGVKKFGNIMYATIGSIKDLGAKFKALGFENLIIDEVHLYPRSVDSMLGNFLATSGIQKVLGLTATPFKLQSNTDMDGNRYSKLQMLTSLSKASATKDQKLGRFFHDIIHVTQIQELTALGYWSSLIYEVDEFDESGLVYNAAKSDYTEESLLFKFEQDDMKARIADRCRHLDRKSVIIFVPSIEEAEDLARMLPDARAVHSKLPDEIRDQIIAAFRAGIVRFVINVNILATGFDHPEVDCIISARPTASLAWFYQALGRGTRIHPDKKDCLIIDIAGNVKRFGRIEHIYFNKRKSWQAYGEGGRLLTNIALHQIGQVFDSPVSGVSIPWGKYKDKDISSVPRSYLEWLVNNQDFTWTDRNLYIKEAAETILRKQTA